MSLANTAVRLKVVLKEVEPKVLRKIAVPFSIRLDRLHLVLQAAFGWESYHLYAFHAGGMQWAIPEPDFDFGDAPIDARKARLCDIVTEAGTKTVDKDHPRHAECADWRPEFDPTKLDKAVLERNVDALAQKRLTAPSQK